MLNFFRSSHNSFDLNWLHNLRGHFDIFVLVSEFLKIPDELSTTHLTERIRSAAFSKIEEAKKRTKEELKKNLTSILKGSSEVASHRVVWDVVFELSAPQILVPEHFADRQALVEDDDDDEFCTPASSPQSCPSPQKFEGNYISLVCVMKLLSAWLPNMSDCKEVFNSSLYYVKFDNLVY